jgi:hypothetical protein
MLPCSIMMVVALPPLGTDEDAALASKEEKDYKKSALSFCFLFLFYDSDALESVTYSLMKTNARRSIYRENLHF